ncbi:MAG: hypothetical protein NC246_13110, partial [Muribaculaceae bacterium]|nr:hypothetical protein [Muribaculaceae bacterium]
PLPPHGGAAAAKRRVAVKLSDLGGEFFSFSDLGGVIVFTDRFHCQAWKKTADRMGSLEIILEKYDGEPLSQEKNGYYRAFLEGMTSADGSGRSGTR